MDDLTVEARLERLEARNKILSDRLRKQQRQSKERRQWQMVLGLAPIFCIVLLVSGFSAKGKYGDSEYNIGLEVDDVVKLVGIVVSGATAWGLIKKDDDTSDDDDEIN